MHFSPGFLFRSIVAVLVLASSTVLISPASAEPGDPPIRVAAFIDVDSDGQRQAGEVDFTDYNAFAYDDQGNFAWGVLDAATGELVIDVSGLRSGSPVADSYRVELVNPNAPYVSGPMGSGTSPALDQSGSSVQTASPGDTIYWGVHNPSLYCQDNAPLATTCFVAGDAITGANAGLDAIVSIGGDYGTNSGDNTAASWQVDVNGTPVTPNTVALTSEVGAVWGEAWSSRRSMLYSAAFLKNASGYGPGGPNAITRPRWIPTPACPPDKRPCSPRLAPPMA